MTDPLTIGGFVASVIAIAAPEAIKSAVGESVKDAYKALKKKLWPCASTEVATLEGAPGSKGKQLAVAEVIDAQPNDEQATLLALAEILVATLKESAPALGLDIGRLTALEVQLGNITVTHGTGVRIAETNVETFKVGDISVTRPGK